MDFRIRLGAVLAVTAVLGTQVYGQLNGIPGTVQNTSVPQMSTGWFWHVTDVHYDFTYEGRQLSCRDHHVDVDKRAYGDYWCDSPWSLVNLTTHAMAAIKKDVDFLLWTGDTVAHISNADLSYAINAEILDNVTTSIASAFPGTQMYPTFGNHDYWPSNQFPANNNDLYNETLDHRWNAWIGGTAQDENFRRGGYYTMLTSQGLRIVALNTNLYYDQNKQVANIADPAGQFDWLNKTLATAVTNHEKVVVTAHIPPGIHTPSVEEWMYPDHNSRLVDILQKYTGVIVAMHFGHDHADGFKVLPNKDGSPGAPVFIAPSVTPWRWKMDHNPAVRLIKYDRQSGKHIGIQQFYLDLPAANKDGGGSSTWKLEYDTQVDYHLPDLTATSLHNLSRKMEDPKSQEFKNYWNYFTVSTASNDKCDEDCHASIVCGFTKFHMDKFKECKAAIISVATSPTSSPASTAVALVVGFIAVHCFPLS